VKPGDDCLRPPRGRVTTLFSASAPCFRQPSLTCTGRGHTWRRRSGRLEHKTGVARDGGPSVRKLRVPRGRRDHGPPAGGQRSDAVGLVRSAYLTSSARSCSWEMPGFEMRRGLFPLSSSPATPKGFFGCAYRLEIRVTKRPVDANAVGRTACWKSVAGKEARIFPKQCQVDRPPDVRTYSDIFKGVGLIT